LSGVSLPAVRRIVRLQTRSENGAGVGACTTGDGRVLERDVRIGGRKDLDHGVEACGLTATGPPRKHLNGVHHVVATGCRCSSRVVACGCVCSFFVSPACRRDH
jgi:hypothetical protein